MNIKHTHVSFLLLCISFVTNTMEIQMPQRVEKPKQQNPDEQEKRCIEWIKNGKLDKDTICQKVLAQYVLFKWHESVIKQDVQKKG